MQAGLGGTIGHSKQILGEGKNFYRLIEQKTQEVFE